jgi:hypothetical protein
LATTREREDVTMERALRGLCSTRLRRSAALLTLLAGALLVVSSSAFARPPVINSVKVSNGEATYTWSLPSGVESRFVETATFSKTNQFGYFDPGENVYSFNVPGRKETKLVDDRKFVPGTYYVHISGRDTVNKSCPNNEFSHTMLFVVDAQGNGSGADTGGGTRPCPSGGGTGGSGDGVKPSQLIKYKHRQHVGKLFVRARMDEHGTLTANATVTIAGSAKLVRFISTTKTVPADHYAKLRLKMKARNLRAVRRALKRGKRLKATVTVIARDFSGLRTSKKLKIRLQA